MGAPNRGPSDSWDGKDDSLWAVFINVLELAVLETLGDAGLRVGYFFKSSMCATILATDRGVFFYKDDTVRGIYRMNMFVSLQLSSFK